MQRLDAVPSLAALIAIAVLGGCGGSGKEPSSADKSSQLVSGSERSILATVDALQTASRKGDGRAVCADLFTPQLVKSVEAAAKRTCAKEVRKRMFTPDAALSVGRDIKVRGHQGTAVVQEQNGDVSRLSFVKQNAQWRIDRVTPVKPG
jgi:hypothetical protein